MFFPQVLDRKTIQQYAHTFGATFKFRLLSRVESDVLILGVAFTI